MRQSIYKIVPTYVRGSACMQETITPTLAMALTRRPGARKSKCHSCRKLKIKCNEARPTCEYCAHTNRECIYDDTCEISPSSVSKRSFSESAIWLKQGKLNALRNHIGITAFEFQLLRYFDEIIIPKKIKDAAAQRLWLVQVPQLFLGSPLVRNSLLSLSAVSVRGLCDLTSWVEVAEVDGEARGMALSAMSDTPNSRQNLAAMIDTYYMSTVKHMSEIMGELSTGKKKIATVEEAAELTFSGSMFFTFLALQSNNLLPLLSFNPAQPDLISICQGVKETLMMCYPILLGTSYSALFQSKDFPTIPESTTKYPFVEYLKECAQQLHSNGDLTETQLKYFSNSLQMLEVLFTASVAHKSSLLLYRWVFLIDSEVFRYTRSGKLYLGFKLLYAYCCLNIFCKFYTSRTANMWLDYIEWYKVYSLQNGRWRDKFDENLYRMVHANFLFSSNDLSILNRFLP